MAQLHHLALGARDVASLAEFYRDVLGLPEVVRHAGPADGSLRSVWLDLGGGVVLMIEKTERESRAVVAGCDAGVFLLALGVEAGSLDRWTEKLEGRGIDEEQQTDFTRYFRDPEGNRFALSHYQLPG
jgi:catechol 2,3-dioxygenase-like lactoylglutathione lyase family enzyme